MTTRAFLLAAAVSLLATGAVNAQTNPTGTLSGRVVDADGEPMGHVGFVVERADGRKPLSKLVPKPAEFVALQ